jgi:alkylhydroperoxidase/carboxymuconolactone decarboxylase family protein YurZ
MAKLPYDETEGFKKGRDVWFEMRGQAAAQTALDAAAQHRPGLVRATRSIITISVLAAMGRIEELKSHIRMGLNNGLTREQLKELFLHAVRAAMEEFEALDKAKA